MAPPSAKVIIVDDAASVRGLLRTLLTNEGYTIVADFASGGALLPAIERTEPDIVCLDYHLPDCDGLTLLRDIRAAHPALAVVMITGDTGIQIEAAAAAAGAAGFIRKPFSPDAILKELQQVAHIRHLLVQTEQAPVSGAVAPRATAVIADDSAMMRQLLKAILEGTGVAVVGEAGDGRQAVDLVASHAPDIVCLDLEMPGMDGLDALRAIRSGNPAAKVMMVTGNATRDFIVEAGKAGARGYILKPFRPEKVAEAIARLLA